jgi:hypothetical protein
MRENDSVRRDPASQSQSPTRLDAEKTNHAAAEAEPRVSDVSPERKNPKSNVDIDALRRAINESLKKQQGGTGAATEKNPVRQPTDSRQPAPVPRKEGEPNVLHLADLKKAPPVHKEFRDRSAGDAGPDVVTSA